MSLEYRFLALVLLGAALTPTLPSPPARAERGGNSCAALWFERNAIYARNGDCFRSERAIADFGAGCFPPFGRLHGREAERVQEIQFWERRNRCPE